MTTSVVLVALAACLATINSELISFDTYVDIVQNQTEYASKLCMLQAVWRHIRADYPDDVYKISTLYSTLYQQFAALDSQIDASKSEIQATNELRKEVEASLISKSALVAAQILREPQLPTGQAFNYLCRNLSAAGAFAKAIYTAAIDQVFELKSLEALATKLFYLNKECNQRLSFETTLKSELYLYDKYQNNSQNNMGYLLTMGYVLQQIRYSASYAKLEKTTQAMMAAAIGSLPSSVRHLYFTSNFCLLNTKHKEYLYTTTKYSWTNGAYYVFTWDDEDITLEPDGAWMPSNHGALDASSSTLRLSFAFRDLLGLNSMYVLPQQQRNYVLVSESAAFKPSWTLQLEDNRLILKQNALYLCADDNMFNERRRAVYAYTEAYYKENASACQWIAEKCPWQ